MIFLRLSAEAEQRQWQRIKKIMPQGSSFILRTDYYSLFTDHCSLITVHWLLSTDYCSLSTNSLSLKPLEDSQAKAVPAVVQVLDDWRTFELFDFRTFIFLRLSAEAEQRLEENTTKSDNNNQWRSALPLGAAKKSLPTGEAKKAAAAPAHLRTIIPLRWNEQ